MRHDISVVFKYWHLACFCTEKNNVVCRKIFEIVDTRGDLFGYNMHQIACQPTTTPLGEFTALPQTP